MMDFSNVTELMIRSLLTENTRNTNVSEPSSFQLRLQDIQEKMFLYVLPIIIFVGSLGNILCFLIMCKSRNKMTSVYLYLALLACADTLVLYCSAFKTWMRLVTGVELLNISDASCKSIFFLLLCSFHMAAWIVVLVTTDRFIAVWLPLKSVYLCTRGRAALTTAILTGVVVVYNLHVFWTFKLSRRGSCVPSNDYASFVLPFNILKLITYSVLPFFIILVLNVAIVWKLSVTPRMIASARWRRPNRQSTNNDSNVSVAETSKQRHPLFSKSTDSKSNEIDRSDSKQACSFKQTQRRLTSMLLAVSACWLLLSGPYSLFPLIVKEMSPDGDTRAVQNFVKAVCFMLYYLNHSINIFLYCLTGKKFRRELWDAICCCCRGGKPAHGRTPRNAIEMDKYPQNTLYTSASQLHHDKI